MILTRIISPPFLPITVEEAREHLRISSDFTDDDSYILSLIYAATEFVETYLQRQIVNSTYKYSIAKEVIDGNNEYITYLPKGRVTSLVSVKYYDINNVEQTVAASGYEFINDSSGQYVRWLDYPDIYDRHDAINISYYAGWDAQEDIPETIKVCIKLLIAEWYRNREATTETNLKEVPFSVQRILYPYRNVRYV